MAHGVKIVTKIPFTNSAEMPTLLIEGYDYGAKKPIGLIMNWYIENGGFVSDKVSSFGGYTPQIELSNESGYVVIFINDTPYFQRFAVRAYANGLSEVPSWFNGWTAVDAALNGTNTVTVPYENDFSGSVFMNGQSGITSFTGTTFFGLVASGASSQTDYSGIDFSGSNQSTPTGRIAVMNTSGGSYLRFGTSNLYSSGITNTAMTVDPNGEIGIGTTSPSALLSVGPSSQFQVNSTGGVTAPSVTFSGANGGTQTTPWTGVLCGGDYAEAVDPAGGKASYEPGDVLVIADGAEDVRKSAEPYATMVAGIYATKPGVVGRRESLPKDGADVPMAMVGIVPTKVTAENGPIHKGDLLVTSSRPGYAMRGTDRSRMLGAVIGKAMGTLDSGTAVIEVLVTLQ